MPRTQWLGEGGVFLGGDWPDPFSSVLGPPQEQASLGRGGEGFPLAPPRAPNSASSLCRRGLKGLAPKCGLPALRLG